MGGVAADLTVALCDFASAFRRDIASEPTRAANALRDLLGPLAEVSSGQRRALSDVVADGRLDRLLDGVDQGTEAPDDQSADENCRWAVSQWSAAVALYRERDATSVEMDSDSRSEDLTVVAEADAAGGVCGSNASSVDGRAVPPVSPVVGATMVERTGRPTTLPPPTVEPFEVLEPESATGAGAASRTDGPGVRRSRGIVIAGAVGLVLLAVVAGLVVVLGGRGEPVRALEVGRVGGDFVEFAPVEIRTGVSVERRWTVEDDRLLASSTLRNAGDRTERVVYDEVIPKEIAASAADLTFDPSPARIIEDDPIVRFVEDVEAGDDVEMSFEVALSEEPSQDDLEAWATSWQAAYDAHLADPDTSPVDGDADGLPDADDDCPSETALDGVGGCLDEDDDGLADSRDDECPGEAGTLDGCLDADGDTVADTKGDKCPTEAGTLDGCADADADGVPDTRGDQCPGEAGALNGCADADADGVPDTQGDACPGQAGTLNGCLDTDGDQVGDSLGDLCPLEAGTYMGCPDRDGDTITDVLDACPDQAAATASGCPDSDGDGVTDERDACPGESGNGSANGCPDRDADDDGVLDADDKCPSQRGSGSFLGCPASQASISGPRTLRGSEAGTYTAVVSNGTFLRWTDGAPENPRIDYFRFGCGGQPFTLSFLYTGSDGRQHTSPAITVSQQCV